MITIAITAFYRNINSLFVLIEVFAIGGVVLFSAQATFRLEMTVSIPVSKLLAGRALYWTTSPFVHTPIDSNVEQTSNGLQCVHVEVFPFENYDVFIVFSDLCVYKSYLVAY